ncbi:MAG: protease modulator HflC [Woeseiaceae bacterium]|nr:protease modulator HflC [Woeseiaceae bacterium]
MSSGAFRVLVIGGIVIVLAGLTLFTVNERDQAIKIRLGEVVESYEEPGLKWKFPLIDTVRKFPKQILTISDRPERVFTAEKRALRVDFFVKYRIVDALRFYTSTGGSRVAADQRLSEIIKNAVVTEFGKRTVAEAISVERADLMRDMLVTAAGTAQDLGVELVDFRVKQVELMDNVKNAVYAQMSAERARIAEELRSEGEAAAEKIRAEADRQKTIILADARREAEMIRGRGDARSAEIYANAFNQNPEFYAFYRSIEAYKSSMGNAGDILVMGPDNEFFRYLNRSRTE